MKVVAIYTTRSMRYARLSQRPDRPLSLAEAEQRDYAEIENVEKGGPIAMADYTIVNDGTKKELFRAVDKLLSTLYTGLIELLSKNCSGIRCRPWRACRTMNGGSTSLFRTTHCDLPFFYRGRRGFGGENYPSPIKMGFITLHFRYRLLSTLSPAS